LADAKTYLAKFGEKLPAKITGQLEKLESRLG
jgi:GTP-dependent phosphoenolpyruvate carboxykinase